ncbi:hypothetical protein ACQHIV_23540 [Kribbella sp. GL6]|uniref:DUF7919 family protein n=1 Tax=Kribbella sp. GL6 TaxID=3419765 RepID=UPI003D09197C
MSYYADLSPYEYLSNQPDMVNIGWLSAEYSYSRGAVPDDFLRALLVWPIDDSTLLRGVHDCDFCDAESPLRVPAPVERGYVSLGMGEFHVASRQGIVYSAPSLIVHYISSHQYKPPMEFLEAVEWRLSECGPDELGGRFPGLSQ